MQVSVVNSYEAASLAVEVIKLRKVDCRKTNVGLYRTACQAVLKCQDYNVLQITPSLPCQLMEIQLEQPWHRPIS